MTSISSNTSHLINQIRLKIFIIMLIYFFSCLLILYNLSIQNHGSSKVFLLLTHSCICNGTRTSGKILLSLGTYRRNVKVMPIMKTNKTEIISFKIVAIKSTPKIAFITALKNTVLIVFSKTLSLSLTKHIFRYSV